VWSLEVVQRYGEYTYRQGEMRGIAGKERIRKCIDVPLQLLEEVLVS
jgi:hypothetical protein